MHRLQIRQIVHNYTVSQKNIPPSVCYNWLTWNNFDIFGGSDIDKVSNQNTVYYATLCNLCFCTTWQNGKHENCIFYWNAVLVHCQNSSNATSSCLISSIFLTHNSYTGVWLPKSCNQCIQLTAVGGMVHGKEVDSTAVVGLCCTHNALVCCLLGFLFHKVMLKH